jgi:HK97 family phage major capsid protein
MKAKQIREALEAKRAAASVKWAEFEEERGKLSTDGYDPAKDGPVLESIKAKQKEYEGLRDEVDAIFKDYETALIADGTKPVSDSPFKQDFEREQKTATPGEIFVDSPEMKELRESGLLSMEKSRISLNPVKALDREQTKTLLTGSGAPGTQLLVNQRLPGIMPLLQAPLQFVNLITVGSTDGNVVEWVRMSAIANNAAEVAEATATTGVSGTKPESGLTLVVESTTVRTIAHWIPATKQALQDMSQLRSLIDGVLIDGVARRLNTEVLAGDGVAPNLRGILNTAGIGTLARGGAGGIGATEPNVEAIYRAITAVRLSFFEPNAVVMHPTNWQAIRLSRDLSGGANTGGYLFGPPSIPGADTLWGLRVVLDTGIPVNTALVADFTQAILYVRDGVSVIATDSHSDFFVRNLVAVLAEGRYALAMPRPTAFCTVTALQ